MRSIYTTRLYLALVRLRKPDSKVSLVRIRCQGYSMADAYKDAVKQAHKLWPNGRFTISIHMKWIRNPDVGREIEYL